VECGLWAKSEKPMAKGKELEMLLVAGAVMLRLSKHEALEA
jgi:hypothetical protein